MLRHQPQKIFLVGPADSRCSLLSTSAALYTLSGKLKADHADDVEVSLFDMYADHRITTTTVSRQIQEQLPSIVGLSLVPGSLNVAKELYSATRALPVPRRPLVVLGSSIPNAFPQVMLSEGFFPHAVLVRGEGEDPLSAIVQARKHGRSIANIPGVQRNTDEGNIACTPAIEPYRLAEQPPPDLQALVDVNKATGAGIYLIASHGCPHNACIFCTGGRTGHRNGRRGMKWQGKSIEQVVGEVRFLMEHDIRFFKFGDEAFIGHGPEGIQRTITLARAIQRLSETSGKQVTFSISCRVDSLWHRRDTWDLRRARQEMLQELSKAGLVKIFMGVESGSNGQLARLKKNQTVEESEQAIAMVRHSKRVRLEIGWIMFDPEVTISELQTNMAFIRRTGIADNIAWFLNPLFVMEGSACAERYRQNSQVLGNNAPDLNTLSYEYRYTDQSVQRLVDGVLHKFEDLNKQLHRLKRHIRQGNGDDGQRERYQEDYRRTRSEMLASFQRILDAFDMNTTAAVVSRELAGLARMYSWARTATEELASTETEGSQHD